MDGLSFIATSPPVECDPARADIACFAGFVARRFGSIRAERLRLESVLGRMEWIGPALPELPRLIPDHVTASGGSSLGFVTWLRSIGWRARLPQERPRRQPVSPADLFTEVLALWTSRALVDWWIDYGYLDPVSAIPAVDLLELRDVPVPIDTWEAFDAYFAWENRPMTAAADRCDATLGVTVRSFFAQGGRKCYVIRLGDPRPALRDHDVRDASVDTFLPPAHELSPMNRASWRGVGHLFALTEVSFLCLPDLPELFAVSPMARVKISPPIGPEVFIECGTETVAPDERMLRGVPPPRCDAAGFERWARFVARIGEFLQRFAREVQFIAAIPLPIEDSAEGRVIDAQWTQAATIRTAFVQLAYPWLRTQYSGAVPGGLEPADGALAGLLAASALTRGSWHSAIRQSVQRIVTVEPVLDRAMLERDLSPDGARRLPLKLRDRVSVIGPAPGGFRLLSDVTTDDDESYRPANVNRLVCAIIRAARVTGEASVFQNNGEEIWAQLAGSMNDLLAGLWAEGALNGASAEEAFAVRCDRSTMTEADVDGGRVICSVSFTAAAPIVQITVVLAMDDSGHLSLASRQSFALQQPQAA
jgi:hypothetical protein